MFCPNCDAFITEGDLIKTKMKKWDDADIEYDARCPACSVEIGKMSWGRLLLRPELLAKQQVRQAELEAESAELEAEQSHPDQEEAPFVDPPLPDSFVITPLTSEDTHWDYDDSKLADQPQYSGGMYQPHELSGHYCPHCGGDLPNDISLLPRRYR